MWIDENYNVCVINDPIENVHRFADQRGHAARTQEDQEKIFDETAIVINIGESLSAGYRYSRLHAAIYGSDCRAARDFEESADDGTGDTSAFPVALNTDVTSTLDIMN